MKKKANTQTAAKEKPFHSVRIEPLTEGGSVYHKLYIDGVRVKGLQNVVVKFGVNQIPMVSLDFLSTDIVIDGTLMNISMGELLTKEVETAKKLMELL